MTESGAFVSPQKCQLYREIHRLHEAGYSARCISRMLHCNRQTVGRYLHGDMESVCAPELRSGVDKYRDFILQSLAEGICRSNILREMRKRGLDCGNTAAYNYMNRLAEVHGIELTPMENCSPEQKAKRLEICKYSYLPRKDVFRYLWMGDEPEPYKLAWLLNNYPVVHALYVCIQEFREVFRSRRQSLMYGFIEKYRQCEWKLLASFAIGLEKDVDAVWNAVSSPLSNGFVEGTNSKLKMVKRTMYGRCSQRLLAAKLMLRIDGTGI